MYSYVFRLIKRKFVSFGVSVFSLALAIASLMACLTIYHALVSGKPLGTHYQGEAVSFFTYSPIIPSPFSIFISPQVIINLATELNGDGEIIASSPAWSNYVDINNTKVHSNIVAVSDNFFDVLKIKFVKGDANEFSGDQPTCLLSQSYVKRLGLDINALPQSIIMSSKSYKVVGVVDTFSGLMDHLTEIWVPWQHGYNILNPTIIDKGLLRQTEYYRAVVISNINDSDKFNKAIKRIEARTDLTPSNFQYNHLKSLKGITSDEKTYDSAKQSTQLYLYISLLIFVVSVLNLSTWISLSRFSKIADELTFLKLGIKPITYFNYHLLLILVPIASAFILAYPIYHWYYGLLQQEPTIHELMRFSAEYEAPRLGDYILLMFGLTFVITLVSSWLIAKATAVGYFVSSFKQKTQSVSLVFRSMLLLASILVTISLVFALFTTQYGVNAISLFKLNNKPIHFSRVSSASAKALDEKIVPNYLSLIKQNNASIKHLGIIQYIPLINVPNAEGFSLEEYGEPVISVIVNQATHGALSALDVKLTNGELFIEGELQQIVVDANTEKKLKKITGQSNILGLKLYDPSSEVYTITGVVSNVNFSNNPLSESLLVYSGFSIENTRAYLVTQGGEEAELKQSLIDIHSQNSFNKPIIIPYHSLIKKNRDPYISRLLLCIISAFVAIVISSLMIFSVANLDIHHRKKTLAIFSCLGLSSLQLWWQANKYLILIIIIGFFIGLLLFWLNRTNPVLQIIISEKNWIIIASFSFVFMIIVSVSSITIAFWRLFVNKPLYNHLKLDE